MIKWLRKKLGINTIDKNIVENNSMTKSQLIEVANSFEMKNDISNLTFKLNNNISLDNSWSLITTQNNKSNFLSQIAGTSSIGSSVAYSANGLYTATANTGSLMTYGNGSLSSITMNGSQFGSHAGFVSANPAVFTPILAVQFASMLTGQYYFKGLTKQLTSVQKGINELISLHHNERLAKLRYINTKTNELNNRNYFTTEDYVIVDRLKYDLSIIRFEYLLSAQQEIINTFEIQNGKENKEEIIDIISEDSNQVEKAFISIKSNAKKISSFFSSTYKKSGIESGINYLKSKTENSHKKVEKLSEKVNNSKFFFYSEIALKSEQLYQLLKLLELKINLSDKKPNHNRIGKIEELYKSIVDFNYEDSIYDEMEQLNSELKENLLSEIEIYKANSQMTKSKIESKATEILENFTRLEQNLSDKDIIFDDIEQIKIGFEKSHQILIDNRSETTRIYTKATDNSGYD
ncbi:hypothetical protein [Winogradskyella poriferorum]|uniref:TolC family protein n=1 Tax=Winogradskyella poriferorum TaxID=307627 RepID=A0ABU7W2P3_9FLAO